MNEIKYQDVAKTAVGEVGYQGKPKSSKYSKELDDVNFFNTKKNGYASWCAIGYCWCVYKNRGTLTIDQVRSILCQPNVDNCGAGCQQQVSYYKKAGRFFTDHSKATTGDQVFFGSDYHHTGMITDWSDEKGGFYVTEFNTDGNKVATHFYSYGDSRISGFGRPDWYKYQIPDHTETPEPTPEPEPTPSKPEKSIDELAKEVIEGKWGNGKDRADRLAAAGYSYDDVQKRVNEILKSGSSSSSTENSAKNYKVVLSNPNSYLRIRSGAGLDYNEIGRLSLGDKVTVYEQKNGWGKINPNKNEWVYMDFLKKI